MLLDVVFCIEPGISSHSHLFLPLSCFSVSFSKSCLPAPTRLAKSAANVLPVSVVSEDIVATPVVAVTPVVSTTIVS